MAGAAVCFAIALPLRAAQEFAPPERLTDGTGVFELARNPNGAAAFDSQGTLHLVYWSGTITSDPSVPTYVWYQARDVSGTWSARTFIDDSLIDTGTGPRHFGGRHPSLAVGPDDTVHVVWHDHRHCTPGAPTNGIDNIEIYLDRKPLNGSFSSTDLRLTNTSAAHLGDNGYLPRIGVSDAGVITVVWYDFHDNSEDTDLYAMRSDAAGNFDLSSSMADRRLTSYLDRNPVDEIVYSVPDLAVDGAGNAVAIWTSGFSGAAPVYLADLPNPVALAPVQTLATGTNSYFEPARITFAPNGDLWAVWTRISGSERDVVAARRAVGAGGFGAPVVLKGAAGVREKGADLEVDAAGNLHVVWIDERAGVRAYYGRFDGTGSLMEESAVSDQSLSVERVMLVLDAADRPHVIFDAGGPAASDVYYVAPVLEPMEAEVWTAYP